MTVVVGPARKREASAEAPLKSALRSHDYYVRTREARRPYNRARNLEYYHKNSERINARRRDYYANNRDKFRIKHLAERESARQRFRDLRWTAECVLAEAWGFDEPVCMWSLLPVDNPLRMAAERKSAFGLNPCDGAELRLEFDHIGGGGRKDQRGGLRAPRLARLLMDGERELDDFRLLCPIHNQWNRLGAFWERGDNQQ